MKTVILAGGYGTRISEETTIRPKPMVDIGGKPILWHIMKIYSSHGIRDFIICLGYKGRVIKDYFSNYYLHASNVTFDLQSNRMEVHSNSIEPWKVTLVDTGNETLTGGRLRRVQEFLGDEAFCFTYGDNVSDIDISNLIAFHREQKAGATMTAVQPPGRFGAFSLASDEIRVTRFREKPRGDGAWINGGFFVCEPRVFDYISDDSISWEQEPLKGLARDGELAAYKHHGFWQNMDTLRDKNVLEQLWRLDKPPWKVW
jgi:glucose-1-phosphate cytidylyltransferase